MPRLCKHTHTKLLLPNQIKQNLNQKKKVEKIERVWSDWTKLKREREKVISLETVFLLLGRKATAAVAAAVPPLCWAVLLKKLVVSIDSIGKKWKRERERKRHRAACSNNCACFQKRVSLWCSHSLRWAASAWEEFFPLFQCATMSHVILSLSNFQGIFCRLSPVGLLQSR